MLSVKTVRDAFLFINLIENPVSIVLHSCSKNYNLVELTHFFEELITPRSDSERAFSTDFIIMHKSFVEI